MNPSERYLWSRLAVVEGRVAALVAARRAVDPDPDDRFRGLYVSDDQVDQMLAGPWPPLLVDDSLAELALAAEASRSPDARLGLLGDRFGLTEAEVELVVIAAAPDLDPRFERLYGYLNDDVSRRRASIGLAMELMGERLGRSCFASDSALVAGGLIEIEDADRPFLTRGLRAPDRVVAWLLGEDEPDALLSGLFVEPTLVEGLASPSLAAALANDFELVYLRDPVGGTALALIAATCRSPVVLDLTRIADVDLGAIARSSAREARLRNVPLAVGPVDAVAERGPSAVRLLAEAPGQVIVVGHRGWDPAWSQRVPLIIEAPTLGSTQRAALWAGLLADDAPADVDLARLTAPFRLTPEQSARAAVAAQRAASVSARPLAAADVHAGARSQNAAGLERLARRVEPRSTWADLVLPPDVGAHVRELCARVRQRDVVFDDWGLGASSSRGRGVTALFAGESGTGKTLSAEVVAAELGLDLYLIDLSTVIDKYVGETEKNLERIFTEADRVNGVLLFDEADAIFGKRSETKDAQDRYANVEIAYLLQRMERFDGLAILTTNLRSNLDDAFTRRLDAVIVFPVPEEDERCRLWRLNLGPGVPQADDLDLPFLAKTFRLTGGVIRNAAVTAALLAAEAGEIVTMRHLALGVIREHQKLGRLCSPRDFGPYAETLN